MENKNSTTQFLILNFNLKKIIFSFLPIYDQRTIYWLNKKLRPLLPDSPLKINLTNLKKCSSYQFDGYIWGLFEHSEGAILSITTEGIKLVKIGGESLVLTTSLPLKTDYNLTYPIKQKNGNIIYGTGHELLIGDKNYNLIEYFIESCWIMTLCNISEVSFAIGLEDSSIKIYTRNSDTQTHVFKEYRHHSEVVVSLLYLPKQNYLLSGSWDKTINVLCLTEEKSIKTLTGHNNTVSSLISLNDETFASSSIGVIKIWSIKADTSIECIKTINADEESPKSISLYNLGSDLMVSTSNDEFKIWDLKNYECLKTYKEDSAIHGLIGTKNESIITHTNNKFNVWQILI
jgi:WD40 repeat protein